MGIDPELDVARLAAVRAAVGKAVRIRIDANQAWNAKQAVRILDQMQEKGLDIEFVEQPVPAADLEGMQYVTRHASVPVLADESVFSPADALRIMQTGAADFVNIKLMKCTGMREAWKMLNYARAEGMKVMVGCMTETSCAVTAAAQISPAVDFADLDGNLLIANDRFEGMTVVDGNITLPDRPGLGLKLL